MSYRYTNTDKWSDSWFSALKPQEKLLFNYLCDNCDIAGFIEVIIKDWSSKIGYSASIIEGALKGLERGFIWSNEKDCIYLKTFLRHQKNLPLNPENKAHYGILKRFEKYMYKFNIQDVNSFIERGLKGASEGLGSPTGNGSDYSSGSIGGAGENWKSDYSIYLNDCKTAFRRFYEDKEFIKSQEFYNPGVNVQKTLMKAYENFWGTEAGWEFKKKKRTKEINWKQTITNAIGLNKVYYTKEEKAQ